MVRGVTRAIRCGCLALCCAGLAGAGCNRASPPAPPARDPAIVLDTPENAVGSLLPLLRAQLTAVAAHDREATRRARDQVVWHIVPQAEMLRRHARLAEASEAERMRMLDTLVESWAAIMAYYADGLELSALQVEPAGGSATTTVVRLPVHAADRRAVLRVTCVFGPQTKEWRVVGLELAPPADVAPPPGATRPATSTVTAPAMSRSSAPATGPAAPVTNPAVPARR